MLKYDLNGNFLYSWGTWGDFPGGFWGVHGMSVDQEGNFYVAEVDNGRRAEIPAAAPARTRRSCWARQSTRLEVDKCKVKVSSNCKGTCAGLHFRHLLRL